MLVPKQCVDIKFTFHVTLIAFVFGRTSTHSTPSALPLVSPRSSSRSVITTRTASLASMILSHFFWPSPAPHTSSPLATVPTRMRSPPHSPSTYLAVSFPHHRRKLISPSMPAPFATRMLSSVLVALPSSSPLETVVFLAPRAAAAPPSSPPSRLAAPCAHFFYLLPKRFADPSPFCMQHDFRWCYHRYPRDLRLLLLWWLLQHFFPPFVPV
jgi:hypothetical protein